MRVRRRVAAVLAAGMAAALMTGGAVVADDQATEFTVVERATTDVIVDVGEPGDTIGDMLAFGNDLYDVENVAIVGRDQGLCFRSNPGLSWECIWTNILEDGSITVQGPFYDDLRDVDLAITGGTGAYASASGTMTLHSRDELGSELDFTFHVLTHDASARGGDGRDHDGDDGDDDDGDDDDGDAEDSADDVTDDPADASVDDADVDDDSADDAEADASPAASTTDGSEG